MRFLPGSCRRNRPAAERFLPRGRTVPARPDGSCQAVPARPKRFLRGSCPVPARFLPGSCPVPATAETVPAKRRFEIENCKFPIPHYQLAADSSHDSPRTGCSPFPRPRRWALALRPEHHPRSDQSGHVEQPACRTRCPKEPHAQRSWHLQRSLPAQSEDLRTEVWLAESLRRRAARRGVRVITRRWRRPLVFGETRPTTPLVAGPPTAPAVAAEGASCAARAVPSDSVSCMLAARRVPTGRFADGVPGAGREPSASVMTKREQRGSVSPATRLQRSQEIWVTTIRLSSARMGAFLLAAAEAATALGTGGGRLCEAAAATDAASARRPPG